MDYQKTYNSLVSKAKSEKREKGRDVYYEAHHIIPVCIGGEGNRADLNHPNIVLLTAREHIISHRLLHLIHPDNPKLAYAYWSMAHNPRYENVKHIMGARQYESLKQIISKEMSIRMMGHEPWNKGIERPEMYGENNPDSVLNEQQVKQIRDLYQPNNTDFTYAKVGSMFGIAPTTVMLIVKGELWSYIPLTPEQQEKSKSQVRGESNWISKMTNDKVKWVRIHIIKGHYTFGIKPLSRMFDMNDSTIGDIVSGKTWKHIVLNDEELKEREYHLKKHPMKGKVEGRRGSDNGWSKLTEEKVISMRKLYETGQYSYSKLVEMFEVSRSTVSAIITRRYWKHI